MIGSGPIAMTKWATDTKGQSTSMRCSVRFASKGNHPNIPGQAHVKFADGDEHEIPPQEIQAKFLWVPFS
jgi:hypothetical protein